MKINEKCPICNQENCVCKYGYGKDEIDFMYEHLKNDKDDKDNKNDKDDKDEEK